MENEPLLSEIQTVHDCKNKYNYMLLAGIPFLCAWIIHEEVPNVFLK